MENLTTSALDYSEDGLEIIVGQVILETLSIIILFLGACFVFRGTEISHPVYGIIFCDLLVCLTFSLINTMVWSFSFKSKWFTAVARGCSLFCLQFHCCCWCVLSVLRYMFVLHKDWMDEMFQKGKTFLWHSLCAVGILFTLNVALALGVTIYFGYPDVSVMEMSIGPKATCLTVIMANFIFMILTSCLCYIKILRQRGMSGQNSVHVAETNEAFAGQLFIIENVYNDRRELEAFNRVQQETLLRKQQAEIRSAILSLKTNLIYTCLIFLVFLSAMVISSDIVVLIFSLLKSLAPVITSLINFVKIRALIKSFYEELRDTYFNPLVCKLKIYYSQLVQAGPDSRGL